MVHPSTCLVEYDPHPIAVDCTNPRFSWKLASDNLSSSRRGQGQTAYRLLVATSRGRLGAEIGDMWDSGKIMSRQSTHVPYAGLPLQSDADYYWTVCVWDKTGAPSPFGQTSEFSTALLSRNDWTASWIGRGSPDEAVPDMEPFWSEENLARLSDVEPDERSVMLRKRFVVGKPVQRARLFISGLGYYELHLNGHRVEDRLLTPAKTHYRRQVLYDTYDLTDSVSEGENALGIMLGNGWFNPKKEWWSWRMQWYGSPRAICQMHIDHTDGTRDVVTSDGTWRSAYGPIVSGCIYSGEVYDARLESPGWSTPGFVDDDWSTATVVAPPGGKLVSAMLEPVLAHETIQPISLTEPQPGVWVYDLGQNFSGWVRLKAEGARGTEVTLRFTEWIDNDGMVDVSNLCLARPTDRYTFKGEGIEIYEPRFTWHGFRYVEITGYPRTPDLETIEGRFVHTACEPIGTFECGNDLINRIHRCTMQSLRSNLQGLPLDCPQRDERLGWLGDAHVTAELAILNRDMGRFYIKWLRDIKEQQDERGRISMIAPRPGIEEDLPWSSAWFLIPWYMYVAYGDTGILLEHYDGLVRYMRFLDTQADDGIQKPCWAGDHLSVAEEHRGKGGMPPSISTAFYYLDGVVLSRIADVLGKTDDALHWRKRTAEIGRAFNREYCDEETGTYRDHTQTAIVLPLIFGICPEGCEGAVLQSLIENIAEKQGGHLTTGLIGTKYLFDALTAKDRPDIAWKVATTHGFPGWEHLLGNDMTSLPEQWDRTGSLNHTALGSIDTWFYRTLAGINPDENHPGYEHVVIRPYLPDDLDWARAETDTIRGRVASGWRKNGRVLHMEVAIPPNSCGTVHVRTAGGAITESGRTVWDDGFRDGVEGIAGGKAEGGYVAFEISSGSYHFESEWE
ncbi:MAG: family 78 glycoside hydrolase catalytic domain [Candidatus Latescibacterota bacterium]